MNNDLFLAGSSYLLFLKLYSNVGKVFIITKKWLFFLNVNLF